jgi:acetone carboxylase gamma subunit
VDQASSTALERFGTTLQCSSYPFSFCLSSATWYPLIHSFCLISATWYPLIHSFCLSSATWYPLIHSFCLISAAQ